MANIKTEEILEILEKLAETCQSFADSTNQELNILGGSLNRSYEIEFERIKKDIRQLINNLDRGNSDC